MATGAAGHGHRSRRVGDVQDLQLRGAARGGIEVGTAHHGRRHPVAPARVVGPGDRRAVGQREVDGLEPEVPRGDKGVTAVGGDAAGGARRVPEAREAWGAGRGDVDRLQAPAVGEVGRGPGDRDVGYVAAGAPPLADLGKGGGIATEHEQRVRGRRLEKGLRHGQRVDVTAAHGHVARAGSSRRNETCREVDRRGRDVQVEDSSSRSVFVVVR